MVQLFYGQYRSEGVHEGGSSLEVLYRSFADLRVTLISGKSFSNEETFGQFPLQVEGVEDIHASLDAAMAQGEIENLNSDVTMKSGQEVSLPLTPSM